MSEIYGYRAQFDSGGISGPSSTIKVTFPSGSTNVTLTGGGKTWKPIQQDSTSAVYQVKWTGTSITYTASATSGGNTKSVSATVSQAYEFIEVQISFAPEWYNTLKTLSLGQYTTIDNYEWLLVHKTSTTATVGLGYWRQDTDTAFGPNNVYKGSTIASLCTTFENGLSDKTKQYLNNVTVNSVTAKVFIPSDDQVGSGSGSSTGPGTLSHYNSNDNRIFRNSSNNPTGWWTSSAYSDSPNVRVVSNTGTLGPGIQTFSFAFRPHMEVNLTL